MKSNHRQLNSINLTAQLSVRFLLNLRTSLNRSQLRYISTLISTITSITTNMINHGAIFSATMMSGASNSETSNSKTLVSGTNTSGIITSGIITTGITGTITTGRKTVTG